MKKSTVLCLHILYWISYLLLLAVVFQGITHEHPVIYNLPFMYVVFGIIPAVVSFYAYYFILLPRYLKKKKLLQLGVAALVVGLASGLISGMVLSAFSDPHIMFVDGVISFTEEIIFMGFLVGLPNGLWALALGAFINWYNDINIKEALIKKNYEMELALIKSQIDPHFLFNTINNIDVLINKDPALASEYLNKLSDIMRFMLYETKESAILLSKEISYIEKYIALQSIRTANTHFAEFRISGAVKNQTIAPMLLIPFIENAFKFADMNRTGAVVQIFVVIENRTLNFTCENYIASNAVGIDAAGLGNSLIKKRIELLYPENHTLQIINNNEIYKVRLSIPLNEN